MIGKIIKNMKKLPSFCLEVRITRQETLDALEFWRHFGVPMPHALKKMEAKLKKNKKYKLTLWDQIVIARAILAQIAEKNVDAFQDECFHDISTECAKILHTANKYDA